MTLVGIGLDLVDLERARRMFERHGPRALARLLTPAEAAYVRGRPDPVPSFAARLAAKEAVFKALATLPDASRVSWREIEIDRGEDGAPRIRLHGHAARIASDLQIMVSLTHSRATAAASAVAWRAASP